MLPNNLGQGGAQAMEDAVGARTLLIRKSKGCFRLVGMEKGELEGFQILQCPSIPADLIEQMADYFRRVVHGETMLEILETVRMDTEGKSHFMKLSITPIHDAQGEVCNWAVHLRDITAQIKAASAVTIGLWANSRGY